MIEVLLVVVAVFVLSALPLHFSVKLLGGKSSIFKVLLVNILVGIIAFVVKYYFNTWGGFIAFVLMIWVYKELFHLGFIRALLAWILQFVFAVLFFLLALLLLGIALL